MAKANFNEVQFISVSLPLVIFVTLVSACPRVVKRLHLVKASLPTLLAQRSVIHLEFCGWHDVEVKELMFSHDMHR